MGLHCSVRPIDRLVYVQAEGTVDVTDTLRMASLLEDYLQDGRVRPGMRILVDFRHAVLLHTYLCLIRTCLRFRAHHRRWVRRTAFLVDSDYAHKLARQYVSLANRLGMTVATFRTTEEAMDWLDLAG
jgi:SpoIIAA-like